MTITDWTGFAGVAMILLAFFLNISNQLTKDHLFYILLNLIGASVACLASVLINYWPFIILEGIWALLSLIALLRYFR